MAHVRLGSPLKKEGSLKDPVSRGKQSFVVRSPRRLIFISQFHACHTDGAYMHDESTCLIMPVVICMPVVRCLSESNFTRTFVDATTARERKVQRSTVRLRGDMVMQHGCSFL